MTTSLVTGGAGFLGSHLCEELLARGHRVICVDNLETGSLANIEHLRSDAFSFAHADIIDPFFAEEPVDFVYHFASPASPIDYLRLPLHTLKVGSYGTHHTLGLAKLHRARFLLLLCVGSGPRHHRARRVRAARPGKRRQPGRVHPARARRSRDRGDRLTLRDRLRGAAYRRSQVRRPDTARAFQLLGWEPTVGLHEGLERTIATAGVAGLVGGGAG
jgi:nucleoside-diphosphate-sugar epimerase